MPSRFAVHFSHTRPDWATPRVFFERQSQAYGPFDLDVCASPENAKCARHFTESDDGLKQP